MHVDYMTFNLWKNKPMTRNGFDKREISGFRSTICDNFALLLSALSLQERWTVFWRACTCCKWLIDIDWSEWKNRSMGFRRFLKVQSHVSLPIVIVMEKWHIKNKNHPVLSIVQIMKKMIGGTFTPTADKLAVFADLKKALKNNQLDYNWIINYNCQILGFGAGGQVK